MNKILEDIQILFNRRINIINLLNELAPNIQKIKTLEF